MYQPSKNALIGLQVLMPPVLRPQRLSVPVTPQRRGLRVSLALHLGIAALLLAAPLRGRVASPPREIAVVLLKVPASVAASEPVLTPAPVPPEPVVPPPPVAAAIPAAPLAEFAAPLPARAVPQAASRPSQPAAAHVRPAVREPLASPGTDAPALPHPLPAPAPLPTPARPVAGMSSNHPPVYPPLALRRHDEGEVWLLVEVSAEGQALTVSVQRSSGHESLDAAAAAAVRQWRFIPATSKGTAIAATAAVPVDFRINP